MPRSVRRHSIQLLNFIWKVLLLYGFIGYVHTPLALSDDRIAVIVSSEIKPYVMALNGFRSSLDHLVSTFYLNTNPEFIRHKISTNPYELIIAIGPEAARHVWSFTPDSQKRMTLMVLDPQKLLKDPDICGVDLRIPIPLQLHVISDKLGPGKVGVLYNPEENQEWIDIAMEAGSEEGLDILPLSVQKREDVPDVLSKAYEQINILWFIPDSIVISEALISYLIKEALLHNIAVVGYNHFFLEQGAVLALTIDYEQVGRLGGKIAQNILAGRKETLYPPPFQIEWNERAWRLITKQHHLNQDRKMEERRR